MLYMIDQAVTALDTQSRRLVGSHSFAKAASSRRAAGEGEEPGDDDGDGVDEDGEEDGEVPSADDNSRLGGARRLLQVAEHINELASLSLDKLGARGGRREGGTRRSSLGASGVSAAQSSASRRMSQGTSGGTSRASGGGALAPPFKPTSTFTSEIDSMHKENSSRGGGGASELASARAAREGLSNAYHMARQAAAKLRAREANPKKE